MTPEQLSKSTIYVTLEPCCHYGKQPPCTQQAMTLDHMLAKKGERTAITVAEAWTRVHHTRNGLVTRLS